MAMLDASKNKIKPGEPLDKDIYDLEPRGACQGSQGARRARRSLNHLERDHEFLLAGRCLHPRRHQHWIWYKRGEGSGRHPAAAASYEFALYYDI